MLRKALPVLAATAALSVPAGAQTLDEVLERSFAARGGLERLTAVRSVRMSGRVRAAGREQKVVIEVKRPSRIRVEATGDDGRSVQGFDGTTAWGIPPGQKKAQALPPEAARGMAGEFDIDGPLVDWRTKGHRVELVGKSPDGAAWQVRVVRKSGAAEDHFLDAASALPVRIVTRRRVQGVEVEGESVLSDYREVAGILWPFSIRSGPRGRADQQQALTVEKLEVDPEIPDERFAMPGR
jgi:hypothetical protein